MSASGSPPSTSPETDALDVLFAEISRDVKAAAEKERAERVKSVVKVGVGDEPPPRSFVVEDWLPEGFVTLLFGHGGSGKSYLALLLSFCVVLGRPFLGRKVKRGAVLWVDGEDLGQEEIDRRAWQVSRGLGLDRPPDGLYYYRPLQSPTSAGVAETVRAAVKSLGVVLVVLDSLSASAVGTDVNAAPDIIKLMRGLQRWGTTVLALDHVSKRAASGDAPATAFGSTFKHNLVRSSLGLSSAKGDPDVVRLDHHKANFAQKSGPIHYSVDFVEGEGERKPSVAFRIVAVSATAMDDEKQPTEALTLDALRDLHAESGEPVPIGEIAERRDLNPKTISNHLSKLSVAGLATSDNGAWTPAAPAPTPSFPSRSP